MNNSTVNSTTSANSTAGLMDSVNVCIHYINLLLGFPTHSYVVWVIVTGRKSGVGLPLFNLNLSVCEIGKCLNSMFALVMYYNKVSCFTILAELLIGIAITGRPLFQCLIFVERYLAVVHPVTFLKYKPLRYRVICCIVAWIITMFSCVVCTITLAWFYVYVWFFLIQLLLYFSITLFCCLAVLRALKQSGPGERKREKEEENNIKRRAFFLFQITTVNIIFIYVPFTISGFSFIVTQSYIYELFTFSFISNVIASFVHPVLFLRQTGKYTCYCST